MRILLLGKDGQIGWELQRTLQPLGEVIALGRDACDLARPADVRNAVRTAAPDLVVNAAAYTAVDKAESEPELAFAINADAVALLAEESRRIGAALVHYSTDYVFDGNKPVPYVETDPVNPLSVYGRSKLAGEQAIAASGVPHLVLRTSWVYALRGRNFLLTILRLAQEKPELRVVNDQHGVPNWAASLADATAKILLRAVDRAHVVTALGEDGGIFHLTCRGVSTWHAFADAIIKAMHGVGKVPLVPVLPIRTEEFPTLAKRPANSVLDGGSLARVWTVTLPDWTSALAACVASAGSIAKTDLGPSSTRTRAS